MSLEPPGVVGSDQFVVTGCQRSGTTLLGMVLEAHPRIDFIEESDRRFHRRGDRGRKLDLDAVVARPSEAGRLAGFKAPRDSHRVDELVRASPSVRVVWMERERRQVVASMLSLEFRDGSWASHVASIEIAKYLDTVEDESAQRLRVSGEQLGEERARSVALAALCWTIKREQRRAAMRALGPRLLVVDYDDLVVAPEPTIVALVDFLGVGWSDCLVDHPSSVDHFPEFRRPGKADSWRSIDTASQRKWTLLSANDLAVVAAVEDCYRNGLIPNW